MPIHSEDSILVDDSQTFSAEDLTEIWAWLDSFDAQPLRPRDGAQLARPPLIFYLDSRLFGDKTCTIVRCSDGRELLGSVIGAFPRPSLTKTREANNLRRWDLEESNSLAGRV